MAKSNHQRWWHICAIVLQAGLATCLGDVNQQPLQEGPNVDYSPPRLNFSSPSPLIFHSTFGLLQQWPQTFFPNGHVIAPCTIPKNTDLYHAHEDESFPPSPEWFGLDAAMAYSILGQGEGSHLLTFRTITEVQCIYFDGTSAALMDDGSMDSQMLLIHNNSANVPDNTRFGRPPQRPPHDGYGPPRGPPGGNWSHFNPLQAEYDRAIGLCEFIKEKNLGGLGWGYEGIVRMNAAFEVIWCNFSSPSAQLVSWLNVSSPTYEGLDDDHHFSTVDSEDGKPKPPGPPRPGKPRGGWPRRQSLPFMERSAWEWFHAAAKTYGFAGGLSGRGETRVKIDSCGLFSFYDPSLEHQSHVRTAEELKLLNLTSDGYWNTPKDSKERQMGLQQLSRRRRYQRATNVSISDGLRMRYDVETRLRNTLEKQRQVCSDIDWVAVTQQIVGDYSPILYEIKTLLSNNTDLSKGTDVQRWLSYLRGAAHQTVMPFYEYPEYSKSSLSQAFSISAPQSRAALERCRTQHAPFIDEELSPSERLTYTSISDVLSAICSTAIPLFLDIEIIWLQNFNNITAIPSKIPGLLQHEIHQNAQHQLQKVEELMAWLGWAEQWTSCSPGCSLGQICAIPIWPVMGVGHFSGGRWRIEDPGEMEEKLFDGRCVVAEHMGGENVW